MNILFYALYPFAAEAGGLERFAIVLGKRFGDDGHKVCYLSTIPNQNARFAVAGQRYLKDAVRAYTTPNRDEAHRMIVEEGIDVIINQMGDNGELTRVIDEARDGTHARLISILHFAPDHLLRIFQASPREILLSGMSWKEQMMYILRNTTLRRGQMKKIVESAYREVYSRSDAVVLLSEAFKEQYVEMADAADITKLWIVPNPYTGEPLDNERVEDGLSHKEREVLMVSRMVFCQKRPDRMLRIWKKVEESCPDWHLTLIGDGDYAEAMRSLIRRWNLKHVTMTGQTDPTFYYRKASILCLTSSTEGFGLVLLEAARHGVVPMAFDSFGAVHDLIEDGENGCLIAPFDLDDYANRLITLIKDSELRNRLAKNAIKQSDKFGLDSIIPRWYHLFESLCSTR